MALVPYKPGEVIKPYCGAKPIDTRAFEETRLKDRNVLGAPTHAWVDVGMADHLRGAIVPNASAAAGSQPTPHLKPRFNRQRCIFRTSVVVASLLETVFCYLAYIEAKAPEGRFYNKFEAHLLLIPWLPTMLLVLTVLDSCFLFISWTLVAVIRLDIHQWLNCARLPLSAVRGVLCLVLVLYGESSKIFAFLSTVAVILNYEVWLFHRRPMDKAGDPLPRTKKGIAAFVIVSLLGVGWCVAFLVDGIIFLQSDECVVTKNVAMPVKIDGVDEWQCVEWEEPHFIRRIPSSSEAIFEAYCSTNFLVFNEVNGGTSNPSSKAHKLRCPPACQSYGLGSAVVGCYVYDATSSVCDAAVQVGILPPDTGGVVEVVGRPPPSRYDRCNLNGVTSIAVRPSNATVENEWAFYFQVNRLQHLDMVHLHGWSTESGAGTKLVNAFKEPNMPWKHFKVNLSWVVGGTTRHQEALPLGPPGGGSGAGIQVNFCHGQNGVKQTCN